MKKYRICTLLLALALSLALAPPARALDDPQPNCAAAILVDGDHGQVLYQHNGYERIYPASITKIMTSLVVLDALDNGEIGLDQQITASQQATTMPSDSSNANPPILAGEVLTIEQLLYCDLLPSANEACNILAEAVAGSNDAFVERMNAKAQALGMEDTHFTNPHGLHDPEHYTTAYDIYVMAQAAMQNELFRTIVSTPTYTIPATNLNGERVLHSTNGLLSNWYVMGNTYSKAIGIKTGSTGEAGRCVAAAAQDDGRTYYCVILGSQVADTEEGNRFSEAERLLEWGFDNFSRITLLDENTEDVIREVEVTLSDDTDFVLAKPVGSIEATMPADYDPAQAELVIDLPQSIQAPVTAGQELGAVSLVYEGVTYGTLPMVAADGVERSQFQYVVHIAQSYWDHWWVQALVVLAAVLLLALIVYLVLIRPRRRRGRRYSYSGSGRRRSSSYRGRHRR